MDDDILDYMSNREEALKQGHLINVSRAASFAGIGFPTAVTRTVWDSCIKVPPGTRGLDEQGRLWEVVWMLRHAFTNGMRGHEIRYHLYVRNGKKKGVFTDLKILCGPGGTGEPVVTVMMPEES